MPLFAYTATAGTSGTRRGQLAADSAYQVRVALRRMGLTPLRVRESVAEKGAPATGAGERSRLSLRTWGARLAQGRRRAALVEVYESLALLLASGTELSVGLELLGGSARRRFGRAPGSSRAQTLCKSLAERVRQGGSLADALADRPDWFGVVDVALVRAAEQSGELERTLSDLAEHHARSDELKGRLASALAYPALLAIFGAGVVVFLTTTTLPQLASVLADSNVALPGPTRVLLALGALLTGRWWLAAPLVLAIAALLGWLLSSDRLARARLRLPLIGPVLLRGQVGGLSLLLSRLLAAGIPLSEALALATPTVRNAALRAALDDVGASLRSGRSIAETLESSGLFEPLFCRALAVGEESGELAPTLQTIGERFRGSTRRLIDRLASVLEPSVILVLAACVGFVVYAAIAPMLRLAQTISS